MGALGAAVVPEDARILTHCNAGALATAGYGTALGVIRGAVEAGKQVTVFADETRPFLQGARLTAWELVREGIQTTVIADNMAGALMRQGKVKFVVGRAHRIGANGGSQVVPTGALVWNPAFDVTPHHLIAGIITERGIVRPPYIESLAGAFEQDAVRV